MPAPQDARLAGLPAARALPAGARQPVRLLFVHGFLGHHRQFGAWLERLSDAGFECHAVSVRGRLGTPPENARGARLSDYVDDVKRALAELGPDTVLVGHSLGGLLCLKALAEGGQARAAILLAPGPERAYFPGPGTWPALPWLGPRVIAGRALKAPFWVVNQIALNRIPEPERRALHEEMVADSGRAYRTFLLGAGADRSRVRCPLLVVAGAEDRVIPVRTARGLARRFGADFEVASGHAHWLPGEPGWEALADGVAGWLARKGIAQPAAVQLETRP